MQSMFRGKRDRAHTTEVKEQNAAASKISAIHRGKAARAEIEEQTKSATAMQSLVRGKRDRRKVEQQRADRTVIASAKANVKKSKSSNTLLMVNEYHLLSELGKGAYGRVYKAARGSKSSDDIAAVKVVSRSILRRKRVGRFGSAYDSVMGEIAVMKALDHPNIVRLYEVIEEIPIRTIPYLSLPELTRADPS